MKNESFHSLVIHRSVWSKYKLLTWSLNGSFSMILRRSLMSNFPDLGSLSNDSHIGGMTAINPALEKATAGWHLFITGLVLAAEKFWSLVSSWNELSHLRGLVDYCWILWHSRVPKGESNGEWRSRSKWTKNNAKPESLSVIDLR